MTDERRKENDRQFEVMKAYLEGKAIQFRNKKEWKWENTYNPTWSWDLFDYRVKPEEDKSKKLMTYRQLAELIAKGYGEIRLKSNLLVKTHFKYDINNGDNPKDEVLIRTWGSKEWTEPTVDIYEEYVSKWNMAFEMGVSKTEKPTSEDSSATEVETVGVHRRTPQEMADFFNCYVAMDKDGTWYLYEKEPFLEEGESDWSVDPKSKVRCIGYSDFFLVEQKPRNWRTLYRPHQEPVVMGEDDD